LIPIKTGLALIDKVLKRIAKRVMQPIVLSRTVFIKAGFGVIFLILLFL
jgi:hypothetical protein